MNSPSSSRKTRLPHNFFTPILAMALIAAPILSQAGIVCEQGIIESMQFNSGGTSHMLISTGGGDTYISARTWIDGKYFTVIEKSTDNIRWRDRVSLIRTAQALQFPIKITANDGSDCNGLTDEFSISVCRPGVC